MLSTWSISNFYFYSARVHLIIQTNYLDLYLKWMLLFLLSRILYRIAEEIQLNTLNIF